MMSSFEAGGGGGEMEEDDAFIFDEYGGGDW